MEVNFQKKDNQLTITINGSIDTLTAPQLENELENNLNGFSELVFDFLNVDYVSSAGLRVLLVANNKVKKENASMKLINVNDDVMEILEMTGFDRLFIFEQNKITPNLKIFKYNNNDFLELPANRNSFAVLKDWLNSVALELNLPDKSRKQILIVADEIFTNIFSYGYPEKTGIAIVQISFDLDNKVIELKFTDKGEPFNPLEEKDPNLNKKDIGGLGTLMVKQIMDDIEYFRQDDCNILILKKRIAL